VPVSRWELDEITARFTGVHKNCSGNKRGNWMWLPCTRRILQSNPFLLQRKEHDYPRPINWLLPVAANIKYSNGWEGFVIDFYTLLLPSSRRTIFLYYNKQVWHIVVEIINTIHWFVPLLYSMYWLLHVSAVACHHQGASCVRLSCLKYRSKR
jgi:hypothetical protein